MNHNLPHRLSSDIVLCLSFIQFFTQVLHNLRGQEPWMWCFWSYLPACLLAAMRILSFFLIWERERDLNWSCCCVSFFFPFCVEGSSGTSACCNSGGIDASSRSSDGAECATGYGKEGSGDSNLCMEWFLGCHESQDVDTNAHHHRTVISLAGNRTDAGTTHSEDTILKSSNLLDTLINDVLDLSRLEDGSLELETNTFKLLQIFIGVKDQHLLVMQPKQISAFQYLTVTALGMDSLDSYGRDASWSFCLLFLFWIWSFTSGWLMLLLGMCVAAGKEFRETNSFTEEAASSVKLSTRSSRFCHWWWQAVNADGSKCSRQCCQVRERRQHLNQGFFKESRIPDGSIDARILSCARRAALLYQSLGTPCFLFILSGVPLSLCISYSTCINFVQIFSLLFMKAILSEEIIDALLSEELHDDVAVMWSGAGYRCGSQPTRYSKAFNKFLQADSTTTRNYSGTGLSLAICKRYDLKCFNDFLL